ncbi:MAG: WYL domain-containing protein [Gordonia sp. (in: high G+C Gram-positive bacteria)]|uniref:helix-turn-helix transcriptional regulator n=1 Tax=Gordonia sp. (in: high G+C Gram-positive bacteria) TaxID=84139 RepID=UPI0039E54147
MATSKNERLLNLVICLMSTRNHVTAEYLRKNVAGYSDAGQSKDSFKRMFERDKNELRTMGIPLETGTDPLGGEEGYRITPEDYALTDISLDAKEAAAVAAAAAVWHDPDVAVESQTAVLKLRAAGLAVQQPTELGLGPTAGGRTVGDERTVRALIVAVGEGRAVAFTHTTDGRTARRTLEPWGVVSHHGRWYATGHDRDRGQTRTFRVSRMSEVDVIGDVGEVVAPPGVDVRAIVADAVRRVRGSAPTRARLWLADGRAHALRRGASDVVDADLGGDPGQQVTVEYRERDTLVRSILAAGHDAVVLDPPELRAAVVAELDALAASAGGGIS